MGGDGRYQEPLLLSLLIFNKLLSIAHWQRNVGTTGHRLLLRSWLLILDLLGQRPGLHWHIILIERIRGKYNIHLTRGVGTLLQGGLVSSSVVYQCYIARLCHRNLNQPIQHAILGPYLWLDWRHGLNITETFWVTASPGPVLPLRSTGSTPQNSSIPCVEPQNYGKIVGLDDCPSQIHAAVWAYSTQKPGGLQWGHHHRGSWNRHKPPQTCCYCSCLQGPQWRCPPCRRTPPPPSPWVSRLFVNWTCLPV